MFLPHMIGYNISAFVILTASQHHITNLGLYMQDVRPIAMKVVLYCFSVDLPKYVSCLKESLHVHTRRLKQNVRAAAADTDNLY